MYYQSITGKAQHASQISRSGFNLDLELKYIKIEKKNNELRMPRNSLKLNNISSHSNKIQAGLKSP